MNDPYFESNPTPKQEIRSTYTVKVADGAVSAEILCKGDEKNFYTFHDRSSIEMSLGEMKCLFRAICVVFKAVGVDVEQESRRV